MAGGPAIAGKALARERAAAAAEFERLRERVAELESKDNSLLAEANSLGFVVDHSVVEITGVCAQCQKHAR